MKSPENQIAQAGKKTGFSVLWALFLSFFKIGICTFGGGYAMIPLIQREAGERRGWIDDKELLEIIAIAESTPGPIAINSATFIGWRTAGFFGALCATLGVSLPSFLILLGLSKVLTLYQDLEFVRYAFFGIRAGVLALMVKALVSLYRPCPKNVFSVVLMLCVLFGAIAANLFGVSVIYLLIACAAVGFLDTLRRAKRGTRT